MLSWTKQVCALFLSGDSLPGNFCEYPVTGAGVLLGIPNCCIIQECFTSWWGNHCKLILMRITTGLEDNAGWVPLALTSPSLPLRAPEQILCRWDHIVESTTFFCTLPSIGSVTICSPPLTQVKEASSSICALLEGQPDNVPYDFKRLLKHLRAAPAWHSFYVGKWWIYLWWW